MRYQRVVWHHDFDDEPVVLWSEVAPDGFERRKVDEYRDGRVDHADERCATGSTRLGDQAVPPIAEIDAGDEFSATEVSREEFEAVWRRATGT